MSGIKKAVKKVWRPIEKLKSKVMNVATLGLWEKTKKIRHKIVKSKAFRIALGAATIYFGGAALMGMMSAGGSAAGGIGSAWAGLKGAGSAVMSGNFSGAASAISSGWSGASASGATFASGVSNTSALIEASAAAKAAGAAGGASANFIPQASPVDPLAGTKLAGQMPQAVNPLLTKATEETAKQGLLSGVWNGLGEAGKAAVVTSGVNMAGQMIQGHAAEKAAEEERKRRTYWGVDGEGRTAQNQPNLGNLNYATPAPPGYTQPPQWQPKTLDDLINETRNRTNANSGLLWG